MSKARLFSRAAYAVLLLVILSCGQNQTDVAFKGHAITVALPVGWTVTANDGNATGALMVLQLTSAASQKPTICLWLGSYSEDLAKPLGIKSGEVMFRSALAAIDPAANVLAYTLDLMGSQTHATKLTFADFVSPSSEVVATVLATPVAGTAGATSIEISAAAKRDAIDKTRLVAEEIANEMRRRSGGK